MLKVVNQKLATYGILFSNFCRQQMVTKIKGNVEIWKKYTDK